MVTFYRRLPKFDYLKPQSLDELLDLLGHSGKGKYKVYAGGTDIIPKLKSRLISAPEILINLKGIPDLDYVSYDVENGLQIGALATIQSVVSSTNIADNFPALFQAARSIASIQVQNRGTIAGNICNAVPSADSAPALLCYNAHLISVSNGGERVIKIEDFFKEPGKTALEHDEILKSIHIPPAPEKSYSVYIKLTTRKRMDLAIVGVAIVISLEEGIVNHIRIGLGSVAPTPMRAVKAESLLLGEEASDEAIGAAARQAADDSKPIDDHRATAEYRKMMVEVLVKRAIKRAVINWT